MNHTNRRLRVLVSFVGCFILCGSLEARAGQVIAWGSNAYGQTNVPAALSDVTALAAGYYHCLALRRHAAPLANDFDGDGVPDLTIFSPPTAVWYVRLSSTGQMLGGGPINWGFGTAIPVPGDYDEDGKTDLAVFDTATGNWYVLQSSNGQMRGGGPQNWGWSGTTPIH